MTPEFRLHMLGELSPEMNDISYTNKDIINGNSGTLSIRPREESLFKMGVGLDIWGWNFYATKFQLDYDLTTGRNYQEYLVSGKVSLFF